VESDEPELRPLPPALKAVTAGKLLVPSRTHPYEQQLEGLCTAFNETGDTIAVGCRNGRVLIINSNTMQTMNLFDLSGGNAAACTAVRFRADLSAYQTQNVMVLALESQLLHVHASTGNVLGRVEEPGNKIHNVVVRQDGLSFATCGSDLAVRVYDDHTNKLTATLDHGDGINTTGHSNSVFGLAWKPDDPNVLVSGGWDHTVLIWDLRVRRSVRSIYGPYVCGDSLDVKGDTILTGSWRHTNPLQLWDLGSTRLLTNLPFHQPQRESCLLYAAKFGTGAAQNLMFGGGSGRDPCLKIYMHTGELLGTMLLPSAVHGLDVKGLPKSRMVAMCCATQLTLLDMGAS